MPICPNGHGSTDEEYCEVCGRAMNGSPSPAPPVTREPEPAPALQGATVCPACGTPLDGRFCEACGHDSLVAPPAAPAVPSPSSAPNPPVSTAPQPPPQAPQAHTWTATVTADRAYYDSVIAIGGPDAGDIAFPAYCPDRYFPLRTNQTSIGRRSTSRGIHPDIDLTGPPEDPGVSHLHAVLVVAPDGALSIVDLGSSNGTTVNDNPTTLRANIPHPLSDGDQIHLGAWTTITVRAG
jgi:hypothetical protein